MPDPEPLSLLSPFQPDFQYDPAPHSPMEQGYEGRNQLSADMRSPLWQALQTELDIPQDCDIVLFGRWWPLARRANNDKLRGRWRGFYIEVIGTFASVDTPREMPLFWLHSAPAGDREGYTVHDPHTYEGTPSTPILARLRRVMYRGGPLWLETRWCPETGETLWLRGVEANRDIVLMRTNRGDTNRQALQALQILSPQLYKGIQLLKAIAAPPGRRRGTGYYTTRDAFHAAYREKHAEVQRQRPGGRVRDEDLWPKLGLGRTAFYDYVRDYGRPVLP